MSLSIRANGIDISYDVVGEGEWLVFSHSLACCKAMWAPQIAVLAKSYKVLSFDTRGHGKTSAPAEPYSLDLMADDFKALCEGLGITRCHFVGLSMGGMIGQTVVLKYPSLLKTLTIADSSSKYNPDGQPFWQARAKTARTQGMQPLLAPTIERWFTAPFRAAETALMAEVSSWIVATPPLGYAAAALAISAVNTTADLHRIKIPTLVIVGADDAATPPLMSEIIQREIAGAELVVLPSAAHIASLEEPVKFTAALASFLKRNG